MRTLKERYLFPKIGAGKMNKQMSNIGARLYFSPCTQSNSKWTNNLNGSSETLEQLEEITGKTLQNIGTGSDFLDRIPIAQGIKARIDR